MWPRCHNNSNNRNIVGCTQAIQAGGNYKKKTKWEKWVYSLRTTEWNWYVNCSHSRTHEFVSKCYFELCVCVCVLAVMLDKKFCTHCVHLLIKVIAEWLMDLDLDWAHGLLCPLQVISSIDQPVNSCNLWLLEFAWWIN